MLYLDTSAFLKLYIREAGSEEVQDTIVSQNYPLPVWEVLEMELMNALQLKVFRKELGEADAALQQALFYERKAKGFYYVPEIARAELMSDFKRLSAHTAKLGCRTMDILHVAFACQLRPNLFISYDQRQKQLAQIAGLTVFGID